MPSTVTTGGRIEAHPWKRQLKRSGATRFSESERISGDVPLHRGHTRPNRSEPSAQETTIKHNDEKHDRQGEEEGEQRSEDRPEHTQDGTE